MIAAIVLLQLANATPTPHSTLPGRAATASVSVPERVETFPAQGFELGAARAAEETRIPPGVPVVVERPDTLNFPGSLDLGLNPPPRITRLVFDLHGRLAVVEAVWPSGKPGEPGEARMVKALEAQVSAVCGPPRGRTGSRDIWWVTKRTSTRLFERIRKSGGGEKVTELVLRQEMLGAMVLH